VTHSTRNGAKEVRLPAFAFVADSEGTLTGRLTDFHSPDAGVAVVSAVDEIRQLSRLASSLVLSMGKTSGLLDPDRSANLATAHATAWLVADGITDVIVAHAEWLKPGVVTDLLQAGLVSGTRTWLIADTQMPEELYQVACSWDADPIEPAEFTRRWSQRQNQGRPAAPLPAPPSDPFPTVPTDDFPTFYGEARLHLTPEEWTRFDSTFQRAYEEARRLFDGGARTEDELSAGLHRLVESASDRAEIITRIRAAQVAAFRSARLLVVDINRFLQRSAEVVSAARLDAGQWKALRAFAKPRNAAVAVLAVLGLSPEEIIDLAESDVEASGASVDVSGRTVVVPDEGRGALVAQHIFRLAAGVDPSLPYVSGTPRERLPSVRSARERILAASRSTGVVIRTQRDRFAPAGLQAWTHRYGVSIRSLI
jgi:hypothetical protein